MNKHIPSKEELTNHQLGPVLAVIREMQPFLLEDTVEPGGTPTAKNLASEVSVAASTTFIKACARVDTILDDAGRFSVKTNEDLVNELVKTHRAQQKFIAAQTASTTMLQRPSFALRPKVAVMGDNYIAFWGDITRPGEAICGVGATPNEALAHFDQAFDKAPKDQVIVIAEKAGIDLSEPKNPPAE